RRLAPSRPDLAAALGPGPAAAAAAAGGAVGAPERGAARHAAAARAGPPAAARPLGPLRGAGGPGAVLVAAGGVVGAAVAARGRGTVLRRLGGVGAAGGGAGLRRGAGGQRCLPVTGPFRPARGRERHRTRRPAETEADHDPARFDPSRAERGRPGGRARAGGGPAAVAHPGARA